MQQFELNFEAGLIEQFPTFGDCLKASVYSCGRPFKAVAADLDMSVSELSRKLAQNPNDPVHFPAVRLAELVETTGDLRPVYWLVEKFCRDADAQRKDAIRQLAQMLPRIEKLLAAEQQ